MAIEVTIPIEDLRKRRIFVATPMYGGQCHGSFAKSMMDLSTLTLHHGVSMKTQFMFNESLITRARNYLADDFLRSDSTHLMFIDSDIGFDPTDVLALAALMSPESENHVMCGLYPKKCISWEKIKRAVDKGFADSNPNQLENFVGDFVFNPTAETVELRLDEPVEVLEGGTGFMMIRRDVFERFRQAYPDRSYKPDHVRSEHFDGSRLIHAYFDCVIDPKTKRYLSEDFMFCQYVRAMGMKVWACPWMRLEHTGAYTFGGSLPDLAAVGVAPTADMFAIGKEKKLGNQT